MKRRFMAALVAGVSALALTACGQSGDKELTIGLTFVPDVQFAPFYVAEHEGFFDEEGVTVALRHHGVSEALFGALTAGEEDLIVAGGDEMLQAYSQGVDVRTIATLYQRYPLAIAARSDLGLTTVADLAGHTIGVPGPFGESWFALLATLESAGLSESDLGIEYIGYTAQSAMYTEAVDAVVVFTNNDLLGLEAAGVDVTLIETPDLPLVGISVGARGDAIYGQPEALAGILRALDRAIEFIVADPDAAIEIVGTKVPEMDADFARAVLDATIPLYGSEWLSLDTSMWPEMYEFMQSHDLAEPGADPDGAYEDLDWTP
ncbi:MAG: ABC transporter substrate-binding protein [Ruaniaceae bacterium]|nr:ABC transporter substrate-binding protein [Ruaniaceae bacterium]